MEFEAQEAGLTAAAEQRDWQTVKQLLDRGVSANSQDTKGRVALHYAAVSSSLQAVTDLLRAGANPNIADEGGWTPLMVSCQIGHVEIATALVHGGAKVNLSNKGGPALMKAAARGHVAVVAMLLDNEALVDQPDCNGFTALTPACKNGHEAVVVKLLDRGANVNKTGRGSSPLLEACLRGRSQLVALILERGADHSIMSEDGWTPLVAACQGGHLEMVIALLDNGAYVNKSGKFSPLYIACQNGHTQVVAALLDNGADVDNGDWKGATPLAIACSNGHMQIVTALLDKDANANRNDKFGMVPLHGACLNGYLQVAIALLDKGRADPNIADVNEVAPLYVACQNGHALLVAELLERGADVNRPTKIGATPLHTACENGQMHIVAALLNNGAKVNCTTETCATPLYIACQQGHGQIAAALLDRGADASMSRKDGSTPLHIACEIGHVEVVEKLLAAGANVNQQTLRCLTPLHVAVKCFHIDVLRCLLAHKPAISPMSISLFTPLQEACFLGNIPALMLILLHMCERQLDLSPSVTQQHASLAAECFGRLATASKGSTCRPGLLCDCDATALREISEELSTEMEQAGFTRTRAALQAAVADVLQSIERKRRNKDHIFIVGSFGDGWGNSLRCVRGVTDADSDLDVTEFVSGRLYHLKGRCACEGVQPDDMMDYEDGHVICVGQAANPSMCYRGSRLRPAYDSVQVFHCCCYPYIEVVHNEGRKSHLPHSLLQSLKQQVNESQCHLVTAAAPGQQGKQLRVSTTFLEKTIMRSMTSVQGQLFIVLKFLVKKVICKLVPGLKTYHAKCLVFYMLEQTPAAQWQADNLVPLAAEALRILLKNLEQADENSNVCMHHFFLRDAAVYLKGGHNEKQLIARAVKDTLAKLPQLLENFRHQLLSLERSRHVFSFHPFLLIQRLDMHSLDKTEPAENPEYHDIYAGVYTVLMQLLHPRCSKQLVTAVIDKMPDSACTAREVLRVMLCCRFNNQQGAVSVLQSHLLRGDTVSRGIVCPSGMTAEDATADMVLQQLQQCDSAYKFCFWFNERPSLEFLPHWVADTFPTGMYNYKGLWFFNFDALMKSLCFELLSGSAPAAMWFDDVISNEDADVQELLMALHYCGDSSTLLRLIHVHAAGIAEHENTLNNVHSLLTHRADLRNESIQKSLSDLRSQVLDLTSPGSASVSADSATAACDVIESVSESFSLLTLE